MPMSEIDSSAKRPVNDQGRNRQQRTRFRRHHFKRGDSAEVVGRVVKPLTACKQDN